MFIRHLLFLGWLLVSQISCLDYDEINSSRQPEISSAEILTNIHYPEKDMVILFHAPWCPYCRQLTPSWNDIIKLLGNRKNLKIGFFNCELPLKNADFCEQMLVDRYPAIFFIGHGNFHQSHPLGSNLVRFEADIIPNALYDWIRFLSFTSRLHRGWNHLKEFTSVVFSSNEKSSMTGSTNNPDQDRVKQLITLEKEMLTLRSQVERYEVLELFDQLPHLGDTFSHLDQALNKTTSNNSTYLISLVDCLSEYAVEYCKYAKKEEYCSIAAECALAKMTFEKCRPTTCPFKERGCRLVSSCLKYETIDRYRP